MSGLTGSIHIPERAGFNLYRNRNGFRLLVKLGSGPRS